MAGLGVLEDRYAGESSCSAFGADTLWKARVLKGMEKWPSSTVLAEAPEGGALLAIALKENSMKVTT